MFKIKSKLILPKKLNNINECLKNYLSLKYLDKISYYFHCDICQKASNVVTKYTKILTPPYILI